MGGNKAAGGQRPQGGGGTWDGGRGTNGRDRDIWPRLPIPHYHWVLALKGLRTITNSSPPTVQGFWLKKGETAGSIKM